MKNAFKQWMINNYSHNEMADIANRGCSGGVGGMIYYKETEAIYCKFAFDLHEILTEYQDAVGSFPDYVINELGNSHAFANAVVWFAAEWVSHEITNGLYIDVEVTA